MRKIVSIALVAGLFASAGAFAAADVQLVDGYVDVIAPTAGSNNAEKLALLAIDDRAGFVKNDFDVTISANVSIGVSDDAANNVFGAIAGSNKGYTVFTGSSVGGSVSQCGDIEKTATGKAASLVVTANLDLDAANGCGR